MCPRTGVIIALSRPSCKTDAKCQVHSNVLIRNVADATLAHLWSGRRLFAASCKIARLFSGSIEKKAYGRAHGAIDRPGGRLATRRQKGKLMFTDQHVEE